MKDLHLLHNSLTFDDFTSAVNNCTKILSSVSPIFLHLKCFL